MATKTITIDLEAYERLRQLRRDHESFSEVIKRVVKRPVDIDAWLRQFEEHALSPEAIEAIEQQIQDRRRKPSRMRRDGLP